MFVDNVDISESNGISRISVSVSGEDIWFELPTEHFCGSPGDTLACLAFFPAMGRQPSDPPAHLEIPEQFPVSTTLLESLPTQQTRFRAWARGLSEFTIDAVAATAPVLDPAPDRRVAASFSGGVDSLFTALTHADEITHLVHIHGFELPLEQDPEGHALPRIRTAAEKLGKDLIVVRTNALTAFHNLRLQRYLVFGAFMATVAHLLGAGRYFIPSHRAISDPTTEGSHPLTDPCWSSESVSIVFDESAEHRAGKMGFLDRQGYLDDVLVCHHSFEQNCCRCEKCVRTMLAIELMGLSGQAFAERVTPAHVRSLYPLTGNIDGNLFGELLTLARQAGRRDLLRAMAYAESKYRMKAIGRAGRDLVDDLLLGGRLATHRAARADRVNASKRQQWFTIIED